MMNLDCLINCDASVWLTHPYQILDVTLRDGGYCNQWCLSEEELLQVTLFLSSLPIHWIEVGYLSNQKQYGSNGTLEPHVLKNIRESMDKGIVGMLFQDEPEPLLCLESRIDWLDLVRLPVRIDALDTVKPIVQFCHERNTECTVNITKASTYTIEDIVHAVSVLCDLSVKAIYLADSRGAFYPAEVFHLFKTLTQSFPTQAFGFHAHDNLSLAFINTQAAIAGGATFIDASLSGMGMGAGNLVTEQVLFHVHQKSPKFSEMIHTMVNHEAIYQLLNLSTDRLKYILSGALNVAQETAVAALDMRQLL